MNLIEDILATFRHNKLRTILTGLSVSWGIFILIILMSAGNGLKNGVMSNFSSRSINKIQIWGGTTSKPYKGLQSNRDLDLREKELEIISSLPESDSHTGIIRNNAQIVFKGESESVGLIGAGESYATIFDLEFKSNSGRFINANDVHSKSKVIVLDKKLATKLFKKEDAIGQMVKVNGIMFKVVGINTQQVQWGGENAYIPYSTAQIIFKPDRKLQSIALTANELQTESENEYFNDKIRSSLAPSMQFDANDENAIWINNSQQSYIETMKIFGGISIFVTIIGLFTLIAGIVGVSNIMLVSVKERTREFGIRKALGATPGNILRSVVVESTLITAIFGYIGMMIGIGISHIVNLIMEQGAAGADGEMQMSVFKNPTVDLNYVFFATAILIVAGVIAGYLPARRATRIKPIEAMREE